MTPEQAKRAFQDALPRRVANFKRNIDGMHHRIAHESNYPCKYPARVLSMAQQEMRERHGLAEKRLEALLDSGWEPSPSASITSAYVDMFNITDFQKHPWTDLYDRVNAAHSEVGRYDPAEADLNEKALMSVQTQAAAEAISNLECYVPKSTATNLTMYNHAPMIQQIGNNNVAQVSQHMIAERDRIRAMVLRAFYDVNETMPGNVEQTSSISYATGIDKLEVDKATLYLAERGLLSVTANKAFLGNNDRLIMAIVTSQGIDVIERPETSGLNYLSSEVVQQITIVNGTHIASGATVNQGNQQIVHGDNTGTMVNASDTGDVNPPITPFPIEELRSLLAEGTPERQAAEVMAQETTSPSPSLGRIAGAMETLKNASQIGEGIHQFVRWATTPDVVTWLHGIASSIQF